MPKKMIQVEVESSGYDVMAHLAKLVAAAKASGGFQASAIPADVAALVVELPAIISAAGAVPADLAESKSEFARGIENGAWEIRAALMGEPLSA